MPVSKSNSIYDFSTEPTATAYSNTAFDMMQMLTLSDCVNMVDAAKTYILTMRPTECSKVARAMGKLDLQDEDLCMGLVQAMRSHLQDSPPIAVAGIMAGLGQVAYRSASLMTLQ